MFLVLGTIPYNWLRGPVTWSHDQHCYSRGSWRVYHDSPDGRVVLFLMGVWSMKSAELLVICHKSSFPQQTPDKKLRLLNNI